MMRALYMLLILITMMFMNSHAGASISPCRNVFQYEDTLILEYEFSEPSVEYDGVYSSITMKNLPLYNHPGEPLLPVYSAKILIPLWKCPSSIRTLSSAIDEFSLEYDIKHGQGAFRRSCNKKPKPMDPNSDIYHLNSPWPGYYTRKVSFQSKRGFRILLLNLFPIQYVPSARKITIAKRLRVEIELHEATDDSIYHPTIEVREGLTKRVDNPSTLNTYVSEGSNDPEMLSLHVPDYYGPRGEVGLQYLVITSPDLANPNNFSDQSLTFQRLCRLKRRQGMTAAVVTTDRIYNDFDGEDPQEKIRNFLKFAYKYWATEFVLLGGNKDIIPVRMFYSDNEFIPCDLYYGCVDPPICSFDGDGDGYYGEVTDGIDGGQVDLYAELYVGRAAVASAEEVSNFIRKTITYEATTNEYLNHVLFSGGYLGFGGVQEFTKPFAELIRQGSDLYGFTTTGIENSTLSGVRDFMVHTLYDQDWFNTHHEPDYDPSIHYGVVWNWHTDGWSAHTDLLPLLNFEGDRVTPQLLYISDHGDINLGMVRLYTKEEYNAYPTLYSSLEYLKNTNYFFFYDDSCWVGSLEHLDSPEYGRCFAELITTIEHGAFACIANSRSGWGSMGDDLNSPSTHLTREFFDAVFGEGIFHLGIAHQDAKEDSIGAIDEIGIRYVIYGLNLFGDPALPLRIERDTAGK